MQDREKDWKREQGLASYREFVK